MIFIPTLSAGGAERVAANLGNIWCRNKNVHVTIILLFDDVTHYPLDDRINILSLKFKPRLGLINRVFLFGSQLRRLRRTVRRENPRFVLSFMDRYNVFCLSALMGTGIPVFVSERGSPEERNREVVWGLRRLLYTMAAGIIAQTQAGRRELVARLGKRNIAVIYNPIESSFASQQTVREPFVLFVGRLVPGKGHSDLLTAFSKALIPGWRLVLCGDGPLRDELESQTRILKLLHLVEFRGTERNVAAMYARAGVFAFPSYHEGFPNALAEAMVSGVPCVSYDCPTGPSEIIVHGENGFLVPVGDIEDLASKLRELMTNTELATQFSVAARRVADKLDADAIAAQYFEFCSQGALK